MNRRAIVLILSLSVLVVAVVFFLARNNSNGPLEAPDYRTWTDSRAVYSYLLDDESVIVSIYRNNETDQVVFEWALSPGRNYLLPTDGSSIELNAGDSLITNTWKSELEYTQLLVLIQYFRNEDGFITSTFFHAYERQDDGWTYLIGRLVTTSYTVECELVFEHDSLFGQAMLAFLEQHNGLPQDVDALNSLRVGCS